MNMDVHLLGPVEVVSDETSVALGGPKQRALLAMLALEAGSTVSVERLIDGLWGDDPPATAAKLVQLYVSHLRKAMAGCADDGAIATRGGGYELRVGRHRVDAARFERLLAQGAAREALSLWRGPPLGDVAKEPFAAPEIRRLDELRTAALEVAIDQDLEAGRHREVLPELESLLAREPLRERLHGQRMLALYRCGRQADALEAYRQARAALVEQIGVEPGPDLRRLHDAILRQDPSLDTPADETGRPGPSTPLLGRDAELERLRSLWWRAREAGGAGVLVTGGRGTGKTRLARELAHEVRRERGAVVWCDGEGDPDVALRAAADARRAERPTLLVMDDLDRAPRRVQDAFRELTGGLPRAPLHGAGDGDGAGRDRGERDARAGWARARCGRRPGSVPRRRARRRRPARGPHRRGDRWCPGARTGGGGRVVARAGSAPARRRGRPYLGRARRVAAGRGRPRHERCRGAGPARARGRRSRRPAASGLPVQGSRFVRRRGRGRLLRARAARGRHGGPAAGRTP